MAQTMELDKRYQNGWPIEQTLERTMFCEFVQQDEEAS